MTRTTNQHDLVDTGPRTRFVPTYARLDWRSLPPEIAHFAGHGSLTMQSDVVQIFARPTAGRGLPDRRTDLASAEPLPPPRRLWRLTVNWPPLVAELILSVAGAKCGGSSLTGSTVVAYPTADRRRIVDSLEQRQDASSDREPKLRGADDQRRAEILSSG